MCKIRELGLLFLLRSLTQLNCDLLLCSAVLRGENPSEVQYEIEMLVATANFENGRGRKPRRTPKKRDQFVDWF